MIHYRFGTSNVIEIKDVPLRSTVVPLLIPPNPPITSGKSTLNPYIYIRTLHTLVLYRLMHCLHTDVTFPTLSNSKTFDDCDVAVHHTDGYSDVSVITRITPLTPLNPQTFDDCTLHIPTISDASMSIDHCCYSRTDQPNLTLPSKRDKIRTIQFFLLFFLHSHLNT